MKKLYVLLLLILLGLMLQPVSSQVNTQPSNVAAPVLRADGGPTPPIWPPSAVGKVLIADGGPTPPIWPPPGVVGTVLA